MTFDEYLALDAINSSALRDIAVSPRHYRRKRMRPTDRDAYRLGRATHTALLEPDRFPRDYVLWHASNGSRRGKAWEAFREAHPNNTILTEAEYDEALWIRDAVREHPEASSLLTHGRAEVTRQWERYGHPCKARLDWLRDDGTIVDVKTTRNPDPARFASYCARYGYHMQAAWYVDWDIYHTGRAPAYKIIAAQNVEPYDVAVYDVPELALEEGRIRNEAAFALLLECQRTDTWPGAWPHELMLSLPNWALTPGDELELTMSGAALNL